MKVRIIAHHVVVSRDVWGEIAGISRQAEALIADEVPADGLRSEYEYDAP